MLRELSMRLCSSGGFQLSHRRNYFPPITNLAMVASCMLDVPS